MPEVKCTVSNCEYWDQGNVCAADQILITAGSTAGKDKHGSGAGRMGHTPVQMAEDCFCWTFTARQDAFMDEDEEVEAGMTIPPLI